MPSSILGDGLVRSERGGILPTGSSDTWLPRRAASSRSASRHLGLSVPGCRTRRAGSSRCTPILRDGEDTRGPLVTAGVTEPDLDKTDRFDELRRLPWRSKCPGRWVFAMLPPKAITSASFRRRTAFLH